LVGATGQVSLRGALLVVAVGSLGPYGVAGARLLVTGARPVVRRIDAMLVHWPRDEVKDVAAWGGGGQRHSQSRSRAAPS
jgi:hypothetical protein